MNITQLQVTRKQLFNNLCASLYDIHVTDGEPSGEAGFHLLHRLATPQGALELFKDGYTACLLPHCMDRIDRFVENSMPFIIVVLSDDEQSIFAVVNGEDASF